MSKPKNISPSVIRRLPKYYRYLEELMQLDIEKISSSDLAKRMNSSASQIRQDLNCFGEFGQQGYGYTVKELHAEIKKILGLDKQWNAILIGAGNLGKALANHMDFDKYGYHLIGVFDKNSEICGEQVGGLSVTSTDELGAFCEQNHPQVAVLCVPDKNAGSVAEELLKMGVNAFWNFSHYDLTLSDPSAVVVNVHLGDGLMHLSFKLKENQ